MTGQFHDVHTLFLGLITFWMYQYLNTKLHWWKLVGVFLIMLLYIGSACFFHLLIDRIIFGL